VMFLANEDKLQAEPGAGARVADDGLRGDFALLDQKMELGFGVSGELLRCFEEEAAGAQISNAGNIVASLAVPKDPDVFRDPDARCHSARGCIGWCHAGAPELSALCTLFPQLKYLGRMRVV